MANEKEQYFQDVQTTERQYIKLLFENFLKIHNCHGLTLSSTENDKNYPTHFDFHTFSAVTTSIFGEFKRRNISSKTLTDCMIEYKKYQPLYDYHRAGHTILYVIMFNDIIACWNLSRLYNNESINTLDRNFYLQDCAASQYNYVKGEEEKLIRDLKFYDCDYILDSETYKQMSYQRYLFIRTNKPPIKKRVYTLPTHIDIDRVKQYVLPLKK